MTGRDEVRETRTLTVSALTRVEGEGALHVTLTDGVVEHVELNIYEAPRFFEALLRGRSYTEPPDITARVCGICPVAYQISACNAIENACGVTIDPALAALRRLLYCGEWIGRLDFPDMDVDHEFLALTHPGHYPIETGTIARSAGETFAVRDFTDHVVETQVPHSTALQARLDGARYLTGPLARYSLNSSRLSPLAAHAAAEAGLGSACRNPFRSILVRAVEVVYAIDEALRIIEAYQPPARPSVEVPARAGVGHGVSEAPRGLLYHRYEIDDDGLVRTAAMVPPTAQNQAAIEHEMAQLVGANLTLDDAALTALCERAIRNHDPCISCSAHFLTLRIERR